MNCFLYDRDLRHERVKECDTFKESQERIKWQVFKERYSVVRDKYSKTKCFTINFE